MAKTNRVPNMAHLPNPPTPQTSLASLPSSPPPRHPRRLPAPSRFAAARLATRTSPATWYASAGMDSWRG
ncbi:hypothetical protein BC938DRAFT_482336 [Jimgerdemannia flammicorona]|uniref:Uncharacterized protein n=1 Tax=Jimgerdemannia flammicorona TaxID=994334 RepID=A0A433QWC9_9FUNG|nr:hypothetical protein BC938DRAFT_482336 [Jimgerdemannia flammicorona]